MKYSIRYFTLLERNSRRRTILAIINFLIIATLITTCSPFVDQVKIVSDGEGHRLQVNDADFMVFGMNWDYFPIGTNYAYSLWRQPDEVIKKVLDEEMPLLQQAGINAIRQYADVPPRWVTYIYENFRIFTMLNHTFARYGLEVDSVWIANVDYSDAGVRQTVLADVESMVNEFRHTPGVLIWLLGNENNYGLHWNSAETQNIPEQQRLKETQARHLYSLCNEAINIIHRIDSFRPVGIANGDLLYIDMIAEEIEHLDIFGANVYRGKSFGNLFEVIDEKLGIPVLFTEFGADAFHAKDMREDQYSQAEYLLNNWREIYEQASGQGNIGNSIGGFTFQFSDGWWKFGLDSNLHFHDTNASWSNGGYSADYSPDHNNMNEEWFGVCAKKASNKSGDYELVPRLAYNVLKQIHSLDPLGCGVNPDHIKNHFSNIDILHKPSLASPQVILSEESKHRDYHNIDN